MALKVVEEGGQPSLEACGSEAEIRASCGRLGEVSLPWDKNSNTYALLRFRYEDGQKCQREQAIHCGVECELREELVIRF